MPREENEMGVTWESFRNININDYGRLTNRICTDITCPKCEKFIWLVTNKILTTYPAQYQYECPNCGWVGYSFNKWHGRE